MSTLELLVWIIQILLKYLPLPIAVPLVAVIVVLVGGAPILKLTLVNLEYINQILAVLSEILEKLR
jgi:hypothetical protein